MPERPRIVNSPPDGSSEDELLLIQEATTKIKEQIVKDVREGQPKEFTQQVIGKLIRELSTGIQDRELRYTVRRSLVQYAQSSYFTHSRNMRTINTNTLNILREKGIVNERDQVEIKDTNYQLSVDGLLSGFELRPSDLINQAQFRQFVTKIGVTVPQIREYQKLVRAEYSKIVAESPKAAYASATGDQSIRNKAEMTIRYNANQEDIARLKEDGVKLVWTSSHENSSKRCEPWQGRLYSMDKTSGTINGVPYTPLDEALNANEGNSIINGYNCRHYLIEYQDGSRAPQSFSKSEIAKQRKIDQQQRYYENAIRHNKINERLARATGNDLEADRIRSRWEKQMLQYEQISLQNGRPFYRWRTQVMRGSNG